MTALLPRLGFDAARLAFSFRTALAVCLAFLLAWALGLEHPQWAGMTVWAAIQPLRGQVLEKSLFRIFGTISGTLAGVALVLASTVHPALLVLGLALWVGACTWIGMLQRGFVAYGTVLAGYTAAMVSLLDSAHPDQVFTLGLDRLATILTGVVVATAVGLIFSPPADTTALRRRLCALIADLLDHLAARATDHTTDRQTTGQTAALLTRMAEMDDTLDPHGAGRLRSRLRVRAARSLLFSAMALLFTRALPAAAVPALTAAATALRDGRPLDAAAALDTATLPDGAEAAAPLSGLAAALRRWADADSTAPQPGAETAFPVILHRDRAGAMQAGLRAFTALILAGALWLGTGFSQGAFLLLGLSVMTTLFSGFENPAGQMRWVFLGQILGVLGAIGVRWLAWPLAGNELEMILLTFPFILVGPFLMAHRRTIAVSFDYNMVMLLLLHPHLPLTGTFGQSVAMGVAVVIAPLAAMMAYRWIYPVSRRRRMDAVTLAMLGDLADLAADPARMADPRIWRARSYHRILRLVRLAGPAAPLDARAARVGEAMLELGEAIARCHALRADRATDAVTRKAAGTVLDRCQSLATNPQEVGEALGALSRQLKGEGASLMSHASAALAALPDHRLKA